jgi:hypothetical protein
MRILAKGFFMKNTKILLTVLAIALVLGMTACGDGGGGRVVSTEDVDTSVIYSSADNSNTYTLEVIKSGSRAAYNPTGGDDYTMTITKMSDGTTNESDGKVKTFSGGKFDLEKGGKSFEVTVADGAMTAITGNIPLNDGTTVTPGTVTRIGTFTLTGIPSSYNGWYAGLYVDQKVTGAIVFNSNGYLYHTYPVISGGKVTIPLWVWDGTSRYSGNDTFTLVEVSITNPKDADDYLFLVIRSPVKSSNGSAAKAWSDGEVDD